MTHRPEDLAATLIRRARQRRKSDEDRLSLAREAAVRVLQTLIAARAVDRAWLIGSAAWGGVHERSDLDIVVEGMPRERSGALWDQLSEACGLDVDLLRLEELEPRFRERVLSEGIPVDGA
jgi:predicted nucleotidyltransferase